MPATQSDTALPPSARAAASAGLPAATLLEWQSAIERRGAVCHARGRLADTLHALALDISGYDDGLPAAERVWLREAVRGPVSHAVQAALDTLTRELASSLGRAPEQVRPSIVVTGPVTRIDFE